MEHKKGQGGVKNHAAILGARNDMNIKEQVSLGDTLCEHGTS
jgi:hypothetical protein